MLAKLVLPTGEERFLTARGITVGRSKTNDISLDDPAMSRVHARFEYVEGVPTVRDLNSTNGTFLNDRKISGTHFLATDSRIQVGNTVLILRFPTAPAQRSATQGEAPPAETPSREAQRAAEVVPIPAVPPQDRRSAALPAATKITTYQLLHLPGGASAVELTPLGDLTIESAEAFRQTYTRLLDSGANRFLLDLAGLDYVDSMGLGTLLQLYRTARAQSGMVWFYNIRPSVRTIFELTGLDRTMNLTSSRECAMVEAGAMAA